MWGEQHFLVPEDKVSLFYDYVTGRGQYEPDKGGYDEDYFWQKYDDRDKSMAGMPILPPGYERFAKKPIEATIVSVGPNQVVRRNGFPDPYYELITPMRLDRGTKSGIRRGMQLYVGRAGGGYVEITR